MDTTLGRARVDNSSMLEEADRVRTREAQRGAWVESVAQSRDPQALGRAGVDRLGQFLSYIRLVKSILRRVQGVAQE